MDDTASCRPEGIPCSIDSRDGGTAMSPSTRYSAITPSMDAPVCAATAWPIIARQSTSSRRRRCMIASALTSAPRATCAMSVAGVSDRTSRLPMMVAALPPASVIRYSR